MKNLTFTITFILVSIALTGCTPRISFDSNNPKKLESTTQPRVRPVEIGPAEPIEKTSSSADAVHLAHDVVAPQAGENQSKGAVGEAYGWMEKYTQATEQLLKSQTSEMKLQNENRELKTQILQLQSKIDQYQRELHDANKEILATTDALEKWKTRVLGLQDLNNKAHEAQLQALYRIIKALGIETSADSSPAADSGKDE